MIRIANWPQQLADEIDAWRDLKFDWGRTDCCQFVGAVCLAITGQDRRELFAGYDSEIGAARLLVKHGGMEGLLTHAFGESKPPALAGRGDVVLCEFGNGPQPTILCGIWCWAPAANGLGRRRLFGDRYPDALMAWSL